MHLLLICTVGSSPDPIVTAIRRWNPARVIFVPSTVTRMIVESVRNDPGLLHPGAWETVELNDAEDFCDCVRQMQRLHESVADWRRKGSDYKVLVDITGGTKCMSAAIAVVSRNWPCSFSYVGGKDRSKDGAGTVVSGTEVIRETQNPWNALGYQAIEDALLLFDQCAIMPCVKLLNDARKAADDKAVKKCLSTFHQFCEGYGLWDRFQHKDAISRFEYALKNRADIQNVLGANHSAKVILEMQRHRDHLGQLIRKPISREMVADLIANARRRENEVRYDDGVARLYRAIESLAQIALAERHRIPSTDGVSLDQVPESLREGWRPRAENNALRLGLQDAYLLLDALGDRLGKEFRALGLDEPKESALTVRNQSILAHGFKSASEKQFSDLWASAMKLGEFKETELPTFPRMSNRGTA